MSRMIKWLSLRNWKPEIRDERLEIRDQKSGGRTGILIMISGFCLLLSGFCFAPRLAAQSTITAASCNESDVAAAVSKATTDGDVVSIPAGTCAWSTDLVVTMTNSITIEGAGAENASGWYPSLTTTGSDQTIIEDADSSGNAIMQITTVSGKSFRLTGIAFHWDSSNSGTAYNGVVELYGTSQAVRIDHCHFLNLDIVDVMMSGWQYGVADHNVFETDISDTNGIRVLDDGWNGDTSPYGGNGSWADTSHWGSNEFFFMEDNVYTGTTGNSFSTVEDCGEGGRYVFRYNQVGLHWAMIDHGTNSQPYRGCRAEEVYMNTFVWNPNESGNSDSDSTLLNKESGTLLFWGNSVEGETSIINSNTIRTSNRTYSETAAPNGWGYCGTGQTGSDSPWDENTNSTGYACLDQVGRGKGDLLSGQAFPNDVNTATGTISWPNQARDPVYVWDTTYTANGWSGDTFWAGTDGVTQENRDYYLQLPNYNESATFNGTAGVGQGSAAPSGSCTAGPGGNTPGVGYWDTSNSTLYVCNPTNTWTAYYTPYTYPHPLDTSTTSSAPAAPTDLAASVN
jgi:hypothetical protein